MCPYFYLIHGSHSILWINSCGKTYPFLVGNIKNSFGKETVKQKVAVRSNFYRLSSTHWEEIFDFTCQSYSAGQQLSVSTLCREFS